MNTLSISVVIPSFNSASTIVRAINSVIGQTHQPDQIIIVDDGSTDDTCQLVENHFPTSILIRQKNAGAAAARNTGVKAAKNELIAFLDSDDYWHRKKLEYQIALFEQDPQLGICSTSCIFIQEHDEHTAHTNINKEIEPCVQQPVSFNHIFRFPFLGTPSVMLRRKVFYAAGGFNENLETAEDVDLWIRSSYISKYKLIRNPLTYVVNQPDSLSSRARVSPYEAHLKVIDQFVYDKKFTLRFRLVTLRQTRAHIYCNWGSGLIINNSPAVAREKLLKSIIYLPTFRAIYLFIKTLMM